MNSGLPLLDWIQPIPPEKADEAIANLKRALRRPPGMVRANGHATSEAAASKVAKVRSGLQEQVLAAFRELGPMTDGEVEKLERFAHCAPSTIRKRRSELYQAGVLVKTNEKRGGMIVWEVRK
jgi:hypothetical protein